ncbi:hypothetical protein PLICRDRAFT_181064 [Plicaturopsis crispa FD-325 SS-3]|uniref:Serine-threonine/tyrosine-protein kinase catalytic domain-containing protein n=1 Tax=Plicaturopsis crispa FD-325 SS-3 TaxID=944288 RepID=A0A0C9T0X0_PLICR|nr:hypothetical protein PLICRDRAFT_181064 [Plicaturopsis crispa FD-325 SS-3]
MFGVELVTGERPFNHLELDAAVSMDIVRGIRPQKPHDNDLADATWSLFEHCWIEDADRRPNMEDICRSLRRTVL